MTSENVSIFQLINKVDQIWYMILLLFITLLIKSIISIVSDFRKIKLQQYSKIAENLFKQKRFNDLMEFCKKKENILGFNGYALWWKGKALIELSEYNQAKKIFKILELEHPHWADSTIIPYLNIINDRINKDNS